MATDLGKAYVQIIPSAKGISGSISKELSGEADSAGKSAGTGFSGKFLSVAKVALKAGAAALGATITASVMEGAKLEQSIGGIETLFGDAADTVINNAKRAYETAGMSANTYMEQATSFSASLLQSLGGDTKEAARVTDMAITDMSDNANKMGTDIERITDAYQGFSRGNFQMLDNLKLGYGGTKTEMERLLSEATKISGVEYNIDNLSDMYEAIHVIQKEMGITGTTALEAADTISGSFASMKAAASNFYGALALGEDIKPYVESLITTTSTFLFDNLIPMVGRIISTLPTAIITFIQIAVPQLLEAGGQLINTLGTGITTGIPEFMEKFYQLMGEVFAFIRLQLPTVLKEGVEFILNFANGFLGAYPTLLNSIGEVLMTVLSAILAVIPDVLQSGYELITGLATGIWKNLPAIVNSITNIIGGLLDTLMMYMPGILRKGIEIIANLAKGIWNNLPQIISTMGQLLRNVIGAIGDRLPDFLQKGLQIVGEVAVGLIKAIPSIVKKVPQIISAVITEFTKLMKQFEGIGDNIVRGLWNGISSAKDWILSKISGFVDSIVGGIKAFFGIKSPATRIADEVGHWIPEGLVVGVEDNMLPVEKAMADMADLTTGTLQSEIAMNAISTGVQTDNGNRRIEITNNNYSPESLSEREIARQTKLSLQKLAYNL